MALATYLVVYLWREAGYSPAQAGLVFAVLHIAGIAARVVLGALADRWMTTRWVLVTIGFVLAVVLLAVAAISSVWPLAVVYVVMAVAGASGNGWVGLYFAELARLSPPTQVAEVAAASQFITYLGIVCGPLLFSAMLVILGGYGLSFIALAVMAAVCGAYLAIAGR
jgi:predicted MFS family arabinose efflux permease